MAKAVSSVTVMSADAFIAIKENPIQRDTERHAQRAKHLLTPLPVHAITWAAKLPNGTLVKLDGHTRALLWKRGIVPKPEQVEVHEIPVDSLEAAAELYKTFDSKEALETTPDKVSGALKGMGYEASSGLVSSGAFHHALMLAWRALYGYSNDNRPRDVYENITEFAAEIIVLDELGLARGQLPAGVIAAIMLSYRKHADEVIPFWRAVIANAGTKSNGRMDGVQAVNEIILAKRGNYGGSAAHDVLARTLAACEKWVAEETLTSVPRPIDISQYLETKARPKYKLIRRAPKVSIPPAKQNGNGATAHAE